MANPSLSVGQNPHFYWPDPHFCWPTPHFLLARTLTSIGQTLTSIGQPLTFYWPEPSLLAARPLISIRQTPHFYGPGQAGWAITKANASSEANTCLSSEASLSTCPMAEIASTSARPSLKDLSRSCCQSKKSAHVLIGQQRGGLAFRSERRPKTRAATSEGLAIRDEGWQLQLWGSAV